MTLQATNDVAQKRAPQSSRLLVVCVVLSVLIHLLLFLVSSRFFDESVESVDSNSNANSITFTLMPPGPTPTVETAEPSSALTREPVVDTPTKARQPISKAALIANKEVLRQIEPVNSDVPSHPQISAVALINRSRAFIRDDALISEDDHERNRLVFNALTSEKAARHDDAIEAYRIAGGDMKVKIRSPLGGYQCFEAPVSPSRYALQEDIWRFSRC